MKLITFILFFLISFDFQAQNWDIDLLKKINVERNQNLDPTFKFITNSMTPLSIGEPIAIISVGLLKKDSVILKKGIISAEALLFTSLITTTMKYSFKRYRPFVTYPFIDNQTSAGSPSFPSGHTSSAFAVATSLSISFPKWHVIIPSFLWAGAVGYSRMHLGVHYPSDVLVGAIIGGGTTWLTYYINKRIQEKRKVKTKL
jgi:membrane-associated phospholipid phosphatase